MDTPEIIELDTDVIALINAGKKIQAIKLMRERDRFLEMAEAVSRVENHISRNPALATSQKSTSNNGMMFLVGFVVLGIILYMAGIIN